MRGIVSRLAAVLLLATTLLAGTLVGPAAACGCGAYQPLDGDAVVFGETSLLRMAGGREDILMRLAVDGWSSEAAWILPVPTVATVRLGDPKVFADLDRVTSPATVVRRHWWPRRDRGYVGATADGSGAQDPAVEAVHELSRQRLGPFDVAVLDARNATALTTWLSQRSYSIPPGLAEGARPYVEQGWKYVAVRLVPDAPGGRLGGSLDPLWVRFPTSEPVYPMRLSATARRPQTVQLFLLGEHRMTRSDGLVQRAPSRTRFAGPVSPSDAPALAPLLDQDAYLTELASYLPDPAVLTEDFRFTPHSTDTPFRRITYRHEIVSVLGVPVAPAGSLVAAFLAALAGVGLLRRRRRGSQRAPS